MNHACYNYKKSGTYEAHCIARIRYMKIRMAKQIKREGMDDGRYSERRELIKMLACSKLGHCWIVHIYQDGGPAPAAEAAQGSSSTPPPSTA